MWAQAQKDPKVRDRMQFEAQKSAKAEVSQAMLWELKMENEALKKEDEEGGRARR